MPTVLSVVLQGGVSVVFACIKLSSLRTFRDFHVARCPSLLQEKAQKSVGKMLNEAYQVLKKAGVFLLFSHTKEGRMDMLQKDNLKWAVQHVPLPRPENKLTANIDETDPELAQHHLFVCTKY